MGENISVNQRGSAVQFLAGFAFPCGKKISYGSRVSWFNKCGTSPVLTPETPHPTFGHLDSLTPARSALRASGYADSFHRFPSGSSFPI